MAVNINRTAMRAAVEGKPAGFAAGAAYIHEVSGGRLRFGIGVAHGPTHQRLGIMAVRLL
jgi:alkanesulfonate monooxygenase SsuD/methylene tetrahydromethanopterin reductase-like flavin-dependent oxidoreductase (luciferase family)